MHFYYLDEAGCTGRDLNNKEQPIFVLGGISVRDEGWNKTQESMAEIIEEYSEILFLKNLNFMPMNYFPQMVMVIFLTIIGMKEIILP